MTARFAVVNDTGQKIYDYFDAALDEREANPTDDILPPSRPPTSTVTG